MFAAKIEQVIVTKWIYLIPPLIGLYQMEKNLMLLEFFLIDGGNLGYGLEVILWAGIAAGLELIRIMYNHFKELIATWNSVFN